MISFMRPKMIFICNLTVKTILPSYCDNIFIPSNSQQCCNYRIEGEFIQAIHKKLFNQSENDINYSEF